jgi:hypothetical protein
MDFRSSLRKRIGTIFPFASPFGSLGLPTFLGFGILILKFLHDWRSNRILC